MFWNFLKLCIVSILFIGGPVKKETIHVFLFQNAGTKVSNLSFIFCSQLYSIIDFALIKEKTLSNKLYQLENFEN